MSTSQELNLQELVKLQKQQIDLLTKQNKLLAATLTVNATIYAYLARDDKGNLSNDEVDVFFNAVRISLEYGR